MERALVKQRTGRGSVEPYAKRVCGVSKMDLREQRHLEQGIAPSTKILPSTSKAYKHKPENCAIFVPFSGMSSLLCVSLRPAE